VILVGSDPSINRKRKYFISCLLTDGATAAEGLEDGVSDYAVVVGLKLQLHHVSARGGADEA
jgi:hypothetical protein